MLFRYTPLPEIHQSHLLLGPQMRPSVFYESLQKPVLGSDLVGVSRSTLILSFPGHWHVEDPKPHAVGRRNSPQVVLGLCHSGICREGAWGLKALG